MKFMVFVNEGETTQLLNVTVGQAVTESLSLYSDKLGNSHCDATLPVEEKEKSVLLMKFLFINKSW